MRKSILFFLLNLTILPPVFSQVHDSSRFNWKPPVIRRAITVPVALIISGILTNGNSKEGLKKEIAEERNEHLPVFKTKADNFIQFAPILVAYGLDAAGVPSKTDLANRTAILFKGELLMMGVVTLMKHTIHDQRPDGSAYNSFPSGHTAQAFAAATFLSEEYKDR